MTTGIDDISDLVRILRERPEWLEAVRGLVISDELAKLPETVARLAASLEELARQTAENFRRVNERLEWLESTVAQLAETLQGFMQQTNERLERLENTVAQLAETLQGFMQQTNERLERLENTVAQLAETLQGFMQQTNERLERLETDMAELKSVASGLQTDVAGLKSVASGLQTDVAGLKSDVADLKTQQTQTNRRLDRVENQISDLRGDVFEITAARRIGPTVIQRMRLYDCRAVVGPGTPLAEEHFNKIRRAARDGIVGRNAGYEVSLTDLILHGYQDDDDQPVWVVVEASVKIDADDISRARQRADILAAVYEETTRAVVVGESIDERDRARAEAANVTVIIIRRRYRPDESEAEEGE